MMTTTVVYFGWRLGGTGQRSEGAKPHPRDLYLPEEEKIIASKGRQALSQSREGEAASPLPP